MLKILVIEDDQAVRTSIRDLLKLKGYEVFLADGGIKGVKLAKDILPDLIICDIMMGDIDGFMVIEQLQKDISTAAIPFLFLTAKADMNDVRKGMGLGADDYLIKPFKAKDLMKAVEVRLTKKKDFEDKFQLIWENSRDGMMLTDEEGEVILINESFAKMIKMKKTQIIGRPYFIIFNKRKDILSLENFVPLLADEFTLWNEDKKWMEFSNSQFQTSSNKTYLLSIIRDISKQKKDELALINSVKEKEVLLKEIHHRVKNNLQIISSLLSLQSNNIEDENSKNIFIDSQSRIRSMSLIHEKLYQTTDWTKINFSDYIEELGNYLILTYETNSEKIKLYVNSTNVDLHVDVAIPTGLILNELITNSLKHAFDGNEFGKIEISLKKIDSQLFLEYSDNGSGFPDDLDYENTSSLGMALITNLTEQLNGNLKISNKKGSNFSFKFQI